MDFYTSITLNDLFCLSDNRYMIFLNIYGLAATGKNNSYPLFFLISKFPCMFPWQMLRTCGRWLPYNVLSITHFMYDKWIWQVPERWKRDTTQKTFSESINHLAKMEMFLPWAFLSLHKDEELPLADIWAQIWIDTMLYVKSWVIIYLEFSKTSESC